MRPTGSYVGGTKTTSDAFDRAGSMALRDADDHVRAAARCLRRIGRLIVNLEHDLVAR